MTDGKMGIKDSINFWKEAWQDMPTLGDVASSTKDSIVNFGRNLSDKVSDKVTDVTHKYDDGIAVSQGTRTLLGESFETLWGSSVEVSAVTVDGWSMTEISGNASYGTEMMSANLTSSSSRRSLDTLQPSQRAAYEIVLLSKQYANLYTPEADASNEAVAQQYTNKMVDYRQYCETNGIAWEQVMSYASWELQTQSLEYREDAKGLCDPQASEDNRVLSNRAHSMMVQCAPEGWEDSLLPHLSGRISYEDTLDTDRRSVTFMSNIGQWFADKWDSVKNFVTAPWRALKANIPNMVDAADKFIEAGDQIYEENMKGYQALNEQMKQTAGAAKEKAEDLYNKATDYFGLSGEEATDELQAGE